MARVKATSTMQASTWVALPLLVICGFGWTATVATIISELQLFLPGWVRARAIAIYLMAFLGSQALASPIWGLITQQVDLRVAMVTAAALVAVSALGGTVLKVPESQHLDRSPLAYWGAPSVALDPEPGAGPIVVSIEYEVAPDQEAAFLVAIEDEAFAHVIGTPRTRHLFPAGTARTALSPQRQQTPTS